jgi:3-hydroxybutyryl-CoA dehydratase
MQVARKGIILLHERTGGRIEIRDVPASSMRHKEREMQKGRNARCWSEFKVGEVIETVGRTVESGDVSLFAGLSGDFNPVHLNELHAKKSQFGTRIAHGLLTLAITSGQMNGTGLFEGTTIGFLGMDKVRFSNPVRFGDTVLTTATITEVRQSDKKNDRGVVSMTITVKNQKDETVLTYDQALLMAAAG